jgi:hypothetical protein
LDVPGVSAHIDLDKINIFIVRVQQIASITGEVLSNPKRMCIEQNPALP